MPDEFKTPDDLISELQMLAADFEPIDAAAFGAEARDELGAYREQQEILARRGREEVPPEGRLRRQPAIVVPERYESQAEFFLVFETFIRFFIDPFVVGRTIPVLVSDSIKGQYIDRVLFRRYGEETQDARDVEQLYTLFDDTRELIATAAVLGRTLFGDRFHESDFWDVQ